MTGYKVAYLGIEGSYSYQASKDVRPGSAYLGYPHFADVVRAVEDGVAECALVPVDNAIAGRIDEIYRQLGKTNLYIIGEYILPIHHCLLRSTRITDMVEPRAKQRGAIRSDEELQRVYGEIREIYSHPQGFAQCRDFLERFLPHAARLESTDTASAAKAVHDHATQAVAAISSAASAAIYSLEILRETIEDEPGNATRFLILSKTPLERSDPVFPAVTTILFETKHEPGSLVSALAAFSANGINLTKLETYMASKDRRKPTFYVDVGEHFYSDRMSAAMLEFSRHVEKWQMLGTYEASPQRGVVSGFLPV